MLSPFKRAVDQLDDPAFLGVVWRSIALAACAFAVLGAGLAWGMAHVFPRDWWLGSWIPAWLGQWVFGVVGGLGAVILTIWLFVPVVIALATLFMDQVAAAVDRRYYPALPPPSASAPLAIQAWDGIALGGQVLLLQGLALVMALLLPGLGLGLGWAISGWGIGRGLFVAVAMRRMPRGAALALYRRNRPTVVLYGVALALAASIPILSLAVPVLGTAVMVHPAQSPSGTVPTHGT